MNIYYTKFPLSFSITNLLYYFVMKSWISFPPPPCVHSFIPLSCYFCDLEILPECLKLHKFNFQNKRKKNTNLFRKERERGAWHMYDGQRIIGEGRFSPSSVYSEELTRVAIFATKRSTQALLPNLHAFCVALVTGRSACTTVIRDRPGPVVSSSNTFPEIFVLSKSTSMHGRKQQNHCQ